MKDVEDLKAKRLALGEAVNQMVEGRALLFTDGEKWRPTCRNSSRPRKERFLPGSGSARGQGPSGPGRELADAGDACIRRLDAFKTNAWQGPASISQALENAELPPKLAAMLKDIKASVIKYADAFDKAGPELLRGDELYYKSISP